METRPLFERILVGSDGSECGLNAVRVAAGLAREHHAALTIIHVYQTPVIPDPTGYSTAVLMDLAVEVHKQVRDLTAPVLRDAEVKACFKMAEGYPAGEIVEVAQRDNIDLIVLGSRGRSQWRSLLLGSVSDAVLHHAHCAVLIVRQ